MFISVIMSAIVTLVSAVDGLVAIGMGIAAFTGVGAGIGIGIATGKSVEAIARQPEAEKKITKTFMFGLIFAETTAIFGVFVALLAVVFQ